MYTIKKKTRAEFLFAASFHRVVVADGRGGEPVVVSARERKTAVCKQPNKETHQFQSLIEATTIIISFVWYLYQCWIYHYVA